MMFLEKGLNYGFLFNIYNLSNLLNIFDVISFLGNEGLVRMFFIVDLIVEEDRIRSEEGY